jgi:hypothetical protein
MHPLAVSRKIPNAFRYFAKSGLKIGAMTGAPRMERMTLYDYMNRTGKRFVLKEIRCVLHKMDNIVAQYGYYLAQSGYRCCANWIV